jgi:Immunity protein 51
MQEHIKFLLLFALFLCFLAFVDIKSKKPKHEAFQFIPKQEKMDKDYDFGRATGMYDNEFANYSVQFAAEEALSDLEIDVEKFFAKYNNDSNGHGWEDLIEFTLQKENPAILSKVDFNCEGDYFFAYCDDEATMLTLGHFINDFLGDVNKVERYLKAKQERNRYE